MIGFVEDTDRPIVARGLGLVSIRERASRLGGTFNILSRPGCGHAPDRQLAGEGRLPKLRLLLGDDHTLVRHGLRKILEEQPEWEVVVGSRRRPRSGARSRRAQARRRDPRRRRCRC